MLRRRLTLLVPSVLIVTLVILVGPSIRAQTADAPRVMLSSSGMEGLSELQVQVHLAGGSDWRELVGLEEAGLKEKIEQGLRGTPGLSLVERPGDTETPRLLVIAVGHLIADTDTSATDLQVSLSQPVIVNRKTSVERPMLATGITWNRNILITGLNSSMQERVDQKLDYLVQQFREEYARSNRGAE